MSEHIYNIFTKSRWELSILDLITGYALIFVFIFTLAGIGALICWLSGKFEKKNKKNKKTKK